MYMDSKGTQTGSTNASTKVFVRDLVDNQEVTSVFVVKESSLAKKSDGDDYLKIVLGDVSGTVNTVCWNNVQQYHAIATPGSFIKVRGKCSVSDKYGTQIKILALEAAKDGTYEVGDLMDAPSTSMEQMEKEFRALIDSINNSDLKNLLESLFSESGEVWKRFSVAPAAKFYHEAYKHGLLEHTLALSKSVDSLSTSFPEINRDLAITGALIHDIGKIDAYNDEDAIDLTDDGKLISEIPLGYYTVRWEIESLDSFPADLARELLHILLSHHGQREHGSPVTPLTREAWVVHMADNLSAKMGIFNRLEKNLHDGENWSDYDKAIGGAAYFGSTPTNDSSAPTPEREEEGLI